jgi:hypothetical protein
MTTHKIEIMGTDVECYDTSSPESKACDELVEQILDSLNGKSIKIIMPALANVLGLVSLDSGVPMSGTLSFVAVTVAAMYKAQERPSNEPLQ